MNTQRRQRTHRNLTDTRETDQPRARRQTPRIQNSYDTPTTTLDVVDFTVTRALELRALREAQSQTNGNRRVYQQLSWHSRRRTMSHSTHRVPARLRLAHTAQLTTPVKPPGPRGRARLRKYRKKARFLHAIRKLRSFTQKWMETHIWHAKRFRMGVIAGRKVAEACNDRGYRSAYRAANRACVICDVSYFDVVEINGDIRSIKDTLRQHMCFEDGRRVSTDPVTNGFRWVTDVVILESDRAIAPCDLLWRPSTSTVWLWTRPEAVKAIINTLSRDGITVKRLARPPVRFRLIGPRSGPILGAVLNSSTIGVDFITRSRDSRCLPSGCVFAGMTKDPRLSFPPKTVGKHVSRVGDCGDSNEVLRMVTDSPLWESSTRESLHELSATANNGSKKQSFDIPFVLLQRSAPPGYDLLLPSGWGCAFWISLMYANTSRAIGTSEHALLRLEHLQPTFPEDYPDSSVAKKLMRDTEEELKAGYARRPKGKRVDYEKYGMTCPWFPDLISVARNEVGIGREKRLKIDEIFVARGRARLGALLSECAWVLGEARIGMQRKGRIASVRKDGKGVVKDGERIDMELCTTFARVVIRAGRGVPQRCGVLCEALVDDFGNDVREEFGVGRSCRRVIGYIVSGGYSISEGVGIGVGFVAISALRRLIHSVKGKKGKVRVLFRNPSSLCYRLAELGVLEA